MSRDGFNHPRLLRCAVSLLSTIQHEKPCARKHPAPVSSTAISVAARRSCMPCRRCSINLGARDTFQELNIQRIVGQGDADFFSPIPANTGLPIVDMLNRRAVASAREPNSNLQYTWLAIVLWDGAGGRQFSWLAEIGSLVFVSGKATLALSWLRRPLAPCLWVGLPSRDALGMRGLCPWLGSCRCVFASCGELADFAGHRLDANDGKALLAGFAACGMTQCQD